MLLVVNKTSHDVFRFIRMFGGNEDKAVLLVGDGVYYAMTEMVGRFEPLEVEDIYVAKDAVEERNIVVSPEAEVVDYDRMAALIMDEYDKVLSL